MTDTTRCEECGKPLGAERFLCAYPVCGACVRKRHARAVGRAVVFARPPALARRPITKEITP